MGARSGKLKSNSTEANILFLGLNLSGKSSVIKSLAKGDCSHHQVQQLTSTKGQSIVKLNRAGFQFNCYDLGGSAEEQSTWEAYYGKAHAVVLVIDSTDRTKFEKAGLLLQRIVGHPKLAGLPLLILAHKQDILDSISGRELTDGLNCSQIKGRMWQVTQTSAVTGRGLNVALSWLTTSMAEIALSQKEIRNAKHSVR